MSGVYRVEPLNKQSRDGFDCGIESLNTYLQRQAGQDQRKRFAVCYLLVEKETDRIAGYYTLSSGGVQVDLLPDSMTKKLPRYPTVPVARLGRLAVAVTHQGRGAGAAMLFDAITRSARAEVGIHAMVVDAINESAARFYQHHGFVPFETDDRILFLPLSDGLKRLANVGAT